MPPGLLSLGIAAGRRRGDVTAGLDQLGVARPGTRRATFRWLGLLAMRRRLGPSTPSRARAMPRREGVDGPRPRERTFSPKEADVARDDGRRAGE